MMNRVKSFFKWMNERLEKIPEYDRNIYSWVISFALVTSLSAAIYALGNPTKDVFYAHFLNIGKYVLLNLILLGAITYVLAALLSFLYLQMPRVAFAAFVYTVGVNIIILNAENSGEFFSIVVGFGYSVLAGMFIALGILFFKYKKRIPVAFILVILFTGLFIGEKIIEPEEWTGELKSNLPGVLTENLAEAGDFDYNFYTYGSGTDSQRDWFGEGVDEITSTADSSHFITKWGSERTEFWGFTEKNLPINGRLWIPEGEGPFPVILMVHGNHTMEYMSTSGYDYLGEQLASHGFIAISVDEDFINYSNIFGSPNRNYELRAWMMMQHLAELQQMNKDENSLLYQKINFDQVGLMGHSRGGQAVAMLADYERFFSAPEDQELLESMEDISIEGIVAIAPTDRSINNERARIRDVSYLLIHGARDADVNDFSNEKQFYRTSFSPNVDYFRASVYVEKANHTQFNTDWGRMDLSMPRGLFLNRKQMMQAKEQQVVAKLYMTAFFDQVFNGKSEYELLFENHHYAKDFLPDTLLVTKYNPASYRVIESFAEEESYADAEGFTSIERLTPKHRRGSSRQREALSLEWSGDARLTIDLSSNNLKDMDKLVFTMANASENMDHLPEVSAEILKSSGKREHIALHEELPIPPIIQTQFTHYGLFDQFFRGERYQNSWEPVFQTYSIKLEDQDQIEEVILHFKGKQGHMMIQEIAVY